MCPVVAVKSGLASRISSLCIQEDDESMVLALEICKQLWEKRDSILVQTFLRLGLLPKLTWIAEDCESFINMLDSSVKKKVTFKRHTALF